jgi:hypothetical protein
MADLEALQDSRRHEVWVGWQTAPADIAAVAIVLIGAEYHDVGTGIFVAAPVYCLAPPLIHLAHGDTGKAFASFAMRLLLPALGYALGAVIGSSTIAWPSARVTVNEGIGLGLGAAKSPSVIVDQT